MSTSEESDLDLEELIEQKSIESPTEFRLGPAIWNREEIRRAQEKYSKMPENIAPVVKMPTRNHHSAPKFDGKAASLSPFLDEVEQLGEACGLSPKQIIEWAIRYAPNEERELWEMQESVGTEEWKKFKKELFELYPGSTGERKYSIANLQTLIDKQALANIEEAEDFGAYRRSFLTVATYLKKKARLTDREISIYFLQGLESSFRGKVQGQLKAENPTHHSDDPYTLAEISTAALFILSCNHTEVSRKDNSPAMVVKRETYDMSQKYENLNINAIAEEVAKRIATLEKQQNTGGPNLPRLTVRNSHCLFCSDPKHYLPNCPVVAEYVQKGLCQKNQEGFVVLPNGNRISARELPGKDLKERIDNWQKSNPAPQVSTNFVGAASMRDDQGQGLEGADNMTKREAEELQILENLVASTQKKIDNTKKRYAPNKSTKEGVATRSKALGNQPEKEATGPQIEKSTRPDPQYRYVTPIEDPALVKKIAQQSLDSPITISTRELLSVAPDIRRHIKDQLITKRVATTAAFMETSEDEPEVLPAPVMVTNVTTENLIVAKQTEELRVIDTLIQGIKVVATVDDGSQIVSIRQDMWEKIGLPIRSDKIMVMESANKSKDATMGLLQDLKIDIGGYDFYLQVQVVKDAPYEMLLGRPFFTLTQATHKHFDNGESRLTLLDPNSGDKITFPTRARDREHNSQGF